LRGEAYETGETASMLDEPKYTPCRDEQQNDCRYDRGVRKPVPQEDPKERDKE
jgi:hypothetical protein